MTPVVPGTNYCNSQSTEFVTLSVNVSMERYDPLRLYAREGFKATQLVKIAFVELTPRSCSPPAPAVRP